MKFEKISADEAHSIRKDVTNDRGVMAKGVPVTPDVVRATGFDKENRTARFVMSAEIEDRMGDIVAQDGLDLTNFQANPQALLFHNSRSWPIGKWIDVAKNLTGRPKRTEGTMKLMPEGEDVDADRAARHIAAGTMRTVSIGFSPDWDQVEAIRDDAGDFTGLRFNAADLLECSLVPIPALPAAAMKELSTGMLSAESLELIKGILEQFELKDGGVTNRADLERAVLDTQGKKSFYLIDNRAVKTHVEIKTVDGVPHITIKADDPAPKDGEQILVAPNPADAAKQKTASEVSLHPISALAGIDLANEIAKTIREEAASRGAADNFMMRLLRSIMPFTTKSEPDQDPVKTDEELLAEAQALDIRKVALIARTAEIQAKAAPLLV